MKDISNQKEEPMKVIYDLFNVPMPFVVPEERHSSEWKKTFSGTMEITQKEKRKLPEEVVNSKKGCYGVTGTPHRIDWSEDSLEQSSL